MHASTTNTIKLALSQWHFECKRAQMYKKRSTLKLLALKKESESTVLKYSEALFGLKHWK